MITKAEDPEDRLILESQFDELDLGEFIIFKPSEDKISKIQEMVFNASNGTVKLSEQLVTKIIYYSNT